MLVLSTGNDPVSQPYQGSVIPLYYESVVVIVGNDPTSSAYEAGVHPSIPYHRLAPPRGIKPLFWR